LGPGDEKAIREGGLDASTTGEISLLFSENMTRVKNGKGPESKTVTSSDPGCY